MAVKIIEQGKLNKPIYHGRCCWCGCRFEFEHKDAIEIEFLDS